MSWWYNTVGFLGTGQPHAEPVLRRPNLFSWDCTRKKVIPIIARGVELGDCDKSRTSCSLREPMKACRASFGAGAAAFWGRYVIPGTECWNPSANPRAGTANSINNVYDYEPVFIDCEIRRIPRRLVPARRDRGWANVLPADGER